MLRYVVVGTRATADRAACCSMMRFSGLVSDHCLINNDAMEQSMWVHDATVNA